MYDVLYKFKFIHGVENSLLQNYEMFCNNIVSVGSVVLFLNTVI